MELGKLIDELHSLRTDKKFHEGEVRRINTHIETLESTILKQMQAQGLTDSKTDRMSVSVDTVVYPVVKDWTALRNYIQSTGMFDLLHKRLSLTSYRQLAEAKIQLPGVEPNTVTELNVRSI